MITYNLVGDVMASVDSFKGFVKKNPILITFVRNNEMTWQKFYEIYDLYGEDSEVWNKYLTTTTKETKKESSNQSFNFSNILNMAKNIDTDKLQDGISSIQKAIGLFGDMLVKDKPEDSSYTPRPIYRKFDD